MQPNNTVGQPYDPAPEDTLPDNQETLADDYLDNAASDVPNRMLDNPEDIPAEEQGQLREAVKDDMPGDTRQAVERQLDSPNEQRNQFQPEYFDTEESTNEAGQTTVGQQSAADAADETDMAGDISEDDIEVEQRIG